MGIWQRSHETLVDQFNRLWVQHVLPKISLTGQTDIPGSYKIWPGCSGTKLNCRSGDVIGWSTRPRDQTRNDEEMI
jgi:hypothetical protein